MGAEKCMESSSSWKYVENFFYAEKINGKLFLIICVKSLIPSMEIYSVKKSSYCSGGTVEDDLRKVTLVIISCLSRACTKDSFFTFLSFFN